MFISSLLFLYFLLVLAAAPKRRGGPGAENQQSNAIEIAEEAGKMYDKFTNLVEDLIKVGERMDLTKNIYLESMKKLTTGKGNLVSKAEKMKKLGAKANKSMRQSLVDRSTD